MNIRDISCLLEAHSSTELLVSPSRGMGYSLVDVTLNDDTLVEQVPISDGTVICFYDDMRKFSEADIKNVAPSQI